MRKFKEISELKQKKQLTGDEKIPVSGEEFVTVGQITGLGDPHEHANQASLDALSVDNEGYLHITQPKEETRKAKAGFADEANHAAAADRAAFAGEATHALDADHATFADNADRWDGSEFSDYVDQPVRRGDGVEFAQLTTPIVQTPEFTPGMTTGKGAAITTDNQGKTTLEVDHVLAREGIEANEAIINQTAHVGGRTIYSAANMECVRVETTEATYRCYFDTKRGQRANLWKIDDQAFCQQFSLDNTIVAKYYWRLVTAVGIDWIDLSRSDADGSGIPTEGDNIIQQGNRTDSSRQSMLEIDTLQGGQVVLYSGINAYTLTNKNEVAFGVKSGKPFLYAYGEVFFGDRNLTEEDATYITFQTAAGETHRRLRVCADLVIGKNSTGLSNLSEWSAVEQKMNDTQAAADAATEKLTDWASDRSISPMEKTALKQQQSDMQSEYAEVIASAGKYAVGTQSYTNAYTAAIAALAKYTATTPESIPIEADYANIAAYYPARQIMLEQISAASKAYSEKLVDEVQVGGVNLLKGTAAFNVGDIAPNYAGWGSSQVETFRGNVVKAIGTAWNGFRLPNFIEDKVPYDCMLSFYARVDSGATDFISITQGGLRVRVESTQWKQYSVFLPAGIIVNNALRQGIMETTSSNKVYISSIKLEKGNKPTDWSPAPEDVQAEISYGKIYLRGTGNNRPDVPIILVNGVSILPSYGRGMMLAVLKRLTMETVMVDSYDTYGSAEAEIRLATEMASYDDSHLIALVSFDAISITTPELKAQIVRCGGSQVNFVSIRLPYALLGIPDIGEGNGLETYTSNIIDAPYAEISVQVINGIPQGIAPPAARTAAEAKAAADAANAQLADIASDSKLTPSEKVETQNRWEEIYAEYPSYVAQAQQLGIDLASYTAAKEALSAYLAPLLADRSVTSEVNYNTFTTAFKAYYNARAALLQTINDEASGGRRQCTIDATALDQNKYYPVIASLYPNARARIRIFTWLGASGIPTWASHSIGFSCSTTWTSISSGWGVMSVRRYVEESFYGWTKDDIIPVGSIGQVIERSLEYIYVRGGGLYHIDSTHTLSATLYPEGWTDGTFSIPIRDSVAAPVVDVDQVKQGLSDVDYLKKAFANGSTEVAGGVVLSEFIGIKDGDKVVAGMTNGQVTNNGVASPVPLIFAGAQGVLSAAQTALYSLDRNGVQRSRDINGNTITIYNGGISFESMTGGVLKKTLSMAPRTFPPSSSNPVTAFADPELIGANAGSFNVQIPQTNVDAEGRQNIPLVVHTGGMVPFAQITLWNKTFPLGATFTIGGDATVRVPAMTISALVDIGFSNWLAANVDMPEHDAYIFLHNEDVGTDIHVDLSMGDGWSVTTREIISTGIPNGRYTLMCRSEGKAVLPFVKFPATAHCSASIHIADTTFSVSWSSTKAVSKIFGNGCTFASRTNQYCGIIGSDTEYIFEHRSGDVGFRADAQGSKVWCPARNEWIPADRVLYKGYVSANGQLRRWWSYKGNKPGVSQYSPGVYTVNIYNTALKAIEDYLVRCTGIGTSGPSDNRYASPYYVSNGVFSVTTVRGDAIIAGDFFFEVIDISDMK